MSEGNPEEEAVRDIATELGLIGSLPKEKAFWTYLPEYLLAHCKVVGQSLPTTQEGKVARLGFISKADPDIFSDAVWQAAIAWRKREGKV